ncbi:hypothetical protein [Streptomyces sp. NPDC018055]|uniref:hypothetical protein n=1 Tax=Streptomyces sp. NPDC018055 TaxID=3365038 RepID=UPI00379545DA
MFSAAEPAHPASTPPIGGSPDHAPNPHDPAASPPADTPSRVVPFARRAPRTGRGRRTPQPAHTERVVAPDSPQQRLAETAEAWFLKRGGTLTDETTAGTYRATIDLVQLMLDGSLHEQIIGEDEYQHLSGMMRGLRDAPDSL